LIKWFVLCSVRMDAYMSTRRYSPNDLEVGNSRTSGGPPGLELAGIPVSPVLIDPRDAQPPELPSYLPAEPAGLLLAPAGSGTKVVG
jgi:hypothetical protein